MLLRYFYDPKLAQASYLVGCQASGEAIVIDPMRNIEPYLKAANEEGVKIVAATETHIHADFISGARELADRAGATLYLSDEGDEDWKYRYLHTVPHRLVKEGDIFKVGNLQFTVMHTPGHTPEHISFLLTDLPASDEPIGIFTGDFVFVGDIGRPDLLEAAAGISGTALPLAHRMFTSVQRFKELPDYLQVWPAHGAGSACGKALGAVPSSTVGYEKKTNWAMLIEDEEEFVNTLLSGQPEAPVYFKHMKRLNKEGPALLRDLKNMEIMQPTPDRLNLLLSSSVQIIDTRPSHEYENGHLAGTINIPFNRSFTNWAGWMIDYDRPVYLIANRNEIQEVTHALHSIGIDEIRGYMDLSYLNSFQDPRIPLEYVESVEPEEVVEEVRRGEIYVLDVRNESEWNEGHLEGAKHIMLGRLKERLREIPTDKPILVHCQLGGRSAIAVSFLKANGFRQVMNLAGGLTRWLEEGFSLKSEELSA
ncbi:MBL fold metallo-hydrolase [Thermicanus aegyptius]|uniref:MBL fold metallo-hydrolase n=1 Tax=Thermicanus aegyptius TaxID=94009 RepID=UPI0004239597|nr:MBL fold metallo-hydrolase [Thermicanus aegyptius]